MSLTTKNQLLIAFKKLVGKSHTNSQFGSANELIGSNIQIDNSTIFSQPIPSSPNSSLYSVTNNIVEKVQFSLVSIGASQYTAVGAAGGGITADGDGAPSQGTFTNGIHAYALVLPSNYQTLSSNPKKGTGVFINNQSLTASNGLLQIVPERYGALYPASVSSSTGIIAPLEEEDYLLDPYSGILFLQDINRVPTSVTAYVYIGDYLTERVSSSLGQFTTITGSTVTGSIARFTTVSSSNLVVSGGNAVFYEQAVLGDNAYVLYNSGIDKLAAFPGLYVTGAITASTVMSAQTGIFTTLTGSTVTGSTALFTILTGSTVTGSTARFTTVSASVVSASSYVGLSGSIVAGGTNTTIQFNSGSSFSGSTNLVYNYISNILSGTTAQFTTITGSTAYFSGNVGIGTTTPDYKLAVIAPTGDGIVARAFSSVADERPVISLDRNRGTTNSFSAVQSGDNLGDFTWVGSISNTSRAGSSSIRSTTTENWGPGTIGSKIQFFTVQNGTFTKAERLTISHDGLVGIGNASPSVTLDVSGSARITGSLTVTGSTTLSTVSGTTAQFTTVTGSTVTGSTSLFATYLASLGTPSSVSFAYSNDLGTGIYFPASNNVGIAGNSINIATFRIGTGTSGQLRMAGNGSATAPTYTWNSSTSTGLYSDVSQQIGISTAGIERVRIDNSQVEISGNLTVGKASAVNSILDVKGNTIISGNLTVTGSITELSTRRIKTNIQSMTNQLYTVNQLNPVSYVRLDDNRKEYGFISEEVKQVYPEFVVGEGINYPKMVSVLVSAVKELTQKVEKQQIEIEQLKNKTSF